jgi:glycosyltransferase involved in cell wall biosynthesis
MKALRLRGKQPLVSIVVPTRNSEATLERCLRSIGEQDYENMEIIVVDNYSSDKTKHIAEKYAEKFLLKGPERGSQVNYGIRMARGKYVYRVDSDFVLNPSVVSEAVNDCETHGYDAIVVHNTSDAGVSFWAKVRKMERDSYKNDETYVAARFWRKEVFLAVGGFDETLVAGDDYDLHNRLLKAGFKIGRIKAEEIHIGEPKTLIELVQKHYYYGRNIGFFIQKNRERALTQLSPLRWSVLKNAIFFGDPELFVGFVVYQFLRYAAAGLGILTARINPKQHSS